MKKAHRAAAQDAKKKDRQVKQELRRARNIRKYGDEEWKKDFQKFTEQLAGIGLTIKDVAGDGNCMFRAIADQMEGDPNRHDHYRQRVCDYLESNEEDFAPFVEDDRTLASHVSDMRKNANWGGHMELQAASMLLGVNFCVHQLAQPRWEIVNHTGTSRSPARVLHLSYHDGQHYASVRNANEDIHKPGPPSTIVIGAVSSSGVSAPKSPIDLDSEDTNWQEDLVLRCTAATNVYFVRAVLLETDGDTDAAIEYIIALSQGSELEESVQREFAYEHGIFPPGGFPDDDVPFFQATSSPATSNPSDNAESSDSSASNKESAKSENTASSISASLSPGIDAETQQLMEHMTDEEMAMFLQQEESRLWSEGHGISTDPSSDFSASSSATSSRSTGNGRQGTSNGSKASSNVSPKKKDSEEERAKAYKGNPKKGSESSAETASSSSSKPVHPKLERFQNQHMSNKQRNALRRMEKEKPPTPQPAPVVQPTADPSDAPEVPADLGSLQI